MDATELEICKATLCLKEQEIYMLGAEIARKGEDIEHLGLAMERLEKTMSACMDRVIRALERRERRR
jgi:hypothetical protein